MKRFLITIMLAGCCLSIFSQEVCWVFFTDKANTTFDPYSYFDAKAIERYRLNHADLYDSTNFPLNAQYCESVANLSDEVVGESRWLNAMAVVADENAIAKIQRLPFVRAVLPIEMEMRLAGHDKDTTHRTDNDLTSQTNNNTTRRTDNDSTLQTDSVNYKAGLTGQLLRMQGELFRKNGIDGRGIRIAVLDGGFNRADSHFAFKHLRDSNRIIATWNFQKKKADVYKWDEHGTYVLSCITGIIDTMQLGLATGSEFLLARTGTETGTKKKNVVWWIQALEWADKNGADIINCSQSYDIFYNVKEMDGNSTVAKAANMAASKGMLLCVAAGNEGADDDWKIIGTPADADSVLTVGGITDYWLYEHSYHSSYGPTVDGRLKPNVCNFFYVRTADVENDSAYSRKQGTSFSAPITTGFAACAWQLRRDLTAMQLKAEIEKSADLYPYYDYALGYGVPQASYFTEPEPPKKDTTFLLKDSAAYILFTPLSYDSSNFLFLHVRDSSGLVKKYKEYSFGTEYRLCDTIYPLFIPKSCIGDNILCICYNGNVSECRLNDSDRVKYLENYKDDEDIIVYNRKLRHNTNIPDSVENEEIHEISSNDDFDGERFDRPDLSRTLSDNEIDWWAERFSTENQIAFGIMLGMGDEVACKTWSPSFHYGDKYLLRLRKQWYWIGASYGFTHTIFNRPAQFGIDTANSSRYRTTLDELSLQLFQRIRFTNIGAYNLYWDLGLYGSYGWTRDKARSKSHPDAAASKQVMIRPDRLEDYRWNYGVTTSLNYNIIGIYASYRVNGLFGDDGKHPDMVLPRLSIGICLNVDFEEW